ncbi:MAG: SGNH/GDSL hydrolase family protein [Lachnospiraceae bacterium]|nr:SGNH/GDSL hydrolase family protein [Lachnospiraceae bacterium]
MKKNKNYNSYTNARNRRIPDVDVIDLENNSDVNDNAEEASDYKEKKRRLPRFINLHTVFLLSIIIFVLAIFFKFKNWGIHIDQAELFKDGAGEYEDNLDLILPLTDANGQIISNEISSIVFFGNAPFADDRASEDGIVSMTAAQTGTEVYNCSISGSYLSAQNYAFEADTDPLDAYSFYWLVTLMTTGANSDYFSRAEEVLGDDTPQEADEVYELLTTVDFNTVDAAVIMYDASDYLIGRYMYNDENYTDITCFTGSLEAGIELLKEYYPDMRIIVLSPTYAYAVVDGKYVSSDIYSIGNLDVLSTYVIKECESASRQGVTFVDNLYGTVTEDNADEYLSDNLHLNPAGRSLVTERLIYAINYYNE